MSHLTFVLCLFQNVGDGAEICPLSMSDTCFRTTRGALSIMAMQRPDRSSALQPSCVQAHPYRAAHQVSAAIHQDLRTMRGPRMQSALSTC